MLLTPDNLLLRVSQNNIWTRKIDDEKLTKNEKNARRKSLSIEEKESYRWITSYKHVNNLTKIYTHKRFVSIGDRESDIFELFMEACNEDSKAKLIARACQNRRTLTDDDSVKLLWDNLLSSKLKFSFPISIPACHKRVAKDSIAEVRYEKVKIKPPKNIKYKE